MVNFRELFGGKKDHSVDGEPPFVTNFKYMLPNEHSAVVLERIINHIMSQESAEMAFSKSMNSMLSAMRYQDYEQAYRYGMWMLSVYMFAGDYQTISLENPIMATTEKDGKLIRQLNNIEEYIAHLNNRELLTTINSMISVRGEDVDEGKLDGYSHEILFLYGLVANQLKTHIRDEADVTAFLHAQRIDGRNDAGNVFQFIEAIGLNNRGELFGLIPLISNFRGVYSQKTE
ncbi:hypothetical protein HGA88_02240 [Candidatus Roizmanbacteria bacterium]|nr:hypothetical protein [Candidatus Roizmanbacteria bacterium]